MPLPKPPPRCPYCKAFDSWGDTPRMLRENWPTGPTYRDIWTCGICFQEWQIPMPTSPTVNLARDEQ